MIRHWAMDPGPRLHDSPTAFAYARSSIACCSVPVRRWSTTMRGNASVSVAWRRLSSSEPSRQCRRVSPFRARSALILPFRDEAGWTGVGLKGE
jgi:hypothetical protein